MTLGISTAGVVAMHELSAIREGSCLKRGRTMNGKCLSVDGLSAEE